MSHARRQSRKALVQALYQWQMTANNIADIEEQFRMENNNAKMDFEYFAELLHKIPAEIDELDALIKPYIARSMDSVNPIELAVLRLGACELKSRPDIPYRVIINEGVDLTKKFGADQGHKFVNGVLDKLAQSLRAVEVESKNKNKASNEVNPVGTVSKPANNFTIKNKPKAKISIKNKSTTERPSENKKKLTKISLKK